MAHAPPPLDPVTRRRLASVVARLGERRAIEALATPRPTLARALAGLGVRRATADVIRARLDALEGAQQ